MDADSTSAVLVEGAYRYARIPEWVLFHDELTATAKLAYAALDRYAGATAKAWPGIPTLAKRLGMDTSTVRRAIRSLEEAGALVTTPRFVDGRQTSNHYRLVGDAPVPTRPGAGAGVPPGAGAGGEAGAGAWGENESQKDREPDEREPCSVEVADAPTPKPRSPQQRLADARIEALALVTRADATRPPAWYKRASKVLRDLGQPEPGELIVKAALYRRQWPTMTLTMEALAKHWAELTPQNALTESERWALEDPKLTDEQRNTELAAVLGPKVMNALRQMAELVEGKS